MSLQHFGKGALRIAKNYTKGYSDTQAKVRDATSNDPWGPSGTQMNELAQLTYNQNDFVEIMEMLDKRLNDKGKNWRHVFKSLTVLDYLLHAGSENVVLYFKDNLYIIKTLKEFQYIDEDGKDCGANVRQKAKDITNLLSDAGRLREERRSRANMRDRMLRGTETPGYAPGYDDEGDENPVRRSSGSQPPRKNRGTDKDEEDLRRAIEASKRTLAEEQTRATEDRDLETAIRLSKEEEMKRNKAVEDSNASALFDDQAQLQTPTSNSNNPFPFLDPNPYATGLHPQPQLQAQFTIQPQYTMQPQFTSFNPYQQQAQQEAMQAEYMRQQQEWLRQQQEIQAQQQQALLQQQQQEEWLRQQQALQAQHQAQQPLFVQPTGFGLVTSRWHTHTCGSSRLLAQTIRSHPQYLQPQHLARQLTAAMDPFSIYRAHLPTLLHHHTFQRPLRHRHFHLLRPERRMDSGSSEPARGPTRTDQEHSHLANLLANRDDGQDTFGNTGMLRYGQTQAGRLAVHKTGAGANNPFAQGHQQSTDQPFFSV
ncbi:hypothetical protein F5J12DRAFT_904568 [Pisolithus orientalis]|uniref:uncharacterized protein n=1 Tax=Pisolithus orientalis TaxID=936130 RepID=UPI0022259CE5|nr:uncharacterized protein F5J12DRAFT_904568 [Pisolithus orientalis]KAI6015326.1 hypothetical protein F5J12DRAFT_904568 [Pisolithus orientalis]